VRALLRRLIPLIDLLAVPLVYPSAAVLKAVRRIGVGRLRRCKRILEMVGVFPILDHYYEPLFKTGGLRSLEGQPRNLPGVDMNILGQLELLRKFHYADELRQFPVEKSGGQEFFYDNGSFESGDAEYLYSVVRLFKPRRVVEVGGGYSTLLIAAALAKNAAEDGSSRGRHICIEPYENPWLERLEIEVIRTPVQRLDSAVFRELAINDVLFIDSSHVIRPRGDVLFECLEVLPILRQGVLVHFHDVFTPRDYPTRTLCDDVKLWNEQYLLEAFLGLNNDYEVIGALNFLAHEYRDELAAKCPIFAARAVKAEPGSFWIRRVRAPQ